MDLHETFARVLTLFYARFDIDMKKTVLTLVTAAAFNTGMVHAQMTHFQPGQLAVLRAGDGIVKQHLKQAPIFIDQYDPKTFNASPSFTVQIPTNGANSFFFNSHAATEGGLSRSADHRFLIFAGYGGVNLLQKPGVPSLLDIERGFCTVDEAGTFHTLFYQVKETDEKINPRGGVSDEGNRFWGCGNSGATLYYDPAASKQPVEFESAQNTRSMKIINHVLYATLNGSDATAIDSSPGIYQFTSATGVPVPLPRDRDVKLGLVVPASGASTKIAGFDMNPAQDVAYMADTVSGIQKYVKSGPVWKQAYSFAIPQNIPEKENHADGCFGLAVDFSGAAPIIYATTTEGYNGTVNSNRVVRIVDTGASAAVSTVAQSPSPEVAFRGIEFAPEAAHRTE
jgi:hypothetical protein